MLRTALAAGDPELAERLAEGLEPLFALRELALGAACAQLAEAAGDHAELSRFRQNTTATGFAFHSTRAGLSTPRAAPCGDRRSRAAAPRRQPAPPTPRSPRARTCRCSDPSDR